MKVFNRYSSILSWILQQQKKKKKNSFPGVAFISLRTSIVLNKESLTCYFRIFESFCLSLFGCPLVFRKQFALHTSLTWYKMSPGGHLWDFMGPLLPCCLFFGQIQHRSLNNVASYNRSFCPRLVLQFHLIKISNSLISICFIDFTSVPLTSAHLKLFRANQRRSGKQVFRKSTQYLSKIPVNEFID